jgi:hypothetical protein
MRIASFIILIITILSCKEELVDYSRLNDHTEFSHKGINKVTDVIIHDIFSPPVASRIYMYSCIAAYEVARHSDSSFISLSGQIKHMPTISAPNKDEEYCWPLASYIAFNNTAKHMIFSEDSITKFNNEVIEYFKSNGLPKAVLQRSIDYGMKVSEEVKTWTKGDNYAQTRSFPKYNVTDEEGRWFPTPPAYMDAIEPSWNKIRPLLMQSVDQFQPLPATPFNMDKSSQFYKEMIEVYEVVNNLTEEQSEIANFWDCNPYKLNVIGHVMHASKKITPGGHWVGIAGIAAKKANYDIAHTWMTYAFTSIGLYEGFISCWDEKYRSNLIRPESVINKFIDENWAPLLQTPPFPEYTSGHSVVSGASSEILTHIFGDNFSFDDDTEVPFGLPIRSFDSFYNAGQEAAVSRLYGGIHYKPAIDNGLTQGLDIGKFVVENIKFTN